MNLLGSCEESKAKQKEKKTTATATHTLKKHVNFSCKLVTSFLLFNTPLCINTTAMAATVRVPVEIKRREVELDPQVSPEEIMSREVELGCES